MIWRCQSIQGNNTRTLYMKQNELLAIIGPFTSFKEGLPVSFGFAIKDILSLFGLEKSHEKVIFNALRQPRNGNLQTFYYRLNSAQSRRLLLNKLFF